MRKLILLLLIQSLPLALTAQAADVVAYADGGGCLPMRPSQFDQLQPLDIGINDMYKTGYGVGGGIGFRVRPQLELIGRVSYASMDFDNEGFVEALTSEIEKEVGIPTSLYDLTLDVDGGQVTMLAFMADTKFSIATGGAFSKLHPYLMGGLGVTRVEISEATFDATVSMGGEVETATESVDSQTETKFAFNLGAGMGYAFTPRFEAFVETLYSQVALSGDPIGTLPVRGGISYRFGS